MSVETDRLVFVQVQKTGSTFINKVLLDLDIGARHVGYKHHRVSADQLAGRMLMASCRNPWDWYISMFSYASGGQGMLRTRLTKMRLERHGARSSALQTAKYLAVQPIKPRRAFQRLLDDGSPQAFKTWLRKLHGRRARWSIAERYAASPAHRYVGLYTWRYLYLLAARERELFDGTLADPSSLQGFLDTGLFEHHLLRNESLADDLVLGLRRAGHVLTQEQEGGILESGHTNRSKRSRDPSDYYDAETLQLVYELDGVLADHFGYSAPEVGGSR